MTFPDRFFYESLLQRDDDSFTRSRKMMLAVAAMADVLPLSWVLTNIYYLSTLPLDMNLITNQVATIILFLTIFGCWLHAKLTRTVSDALMDVWLLGINVSTILIVGSTGYPSCVPIFQTMATLAVACNTPWLRYHLAVSVVGMCLVVGMFLAQYNQATEPFGNFLITRHIWASFFFVVGVVIVSSLSSEHNKMCQSASKGLLMAQGVTQKLIAHDTAGAKAILALVDQGGGGGTVDPKLVAAFAQITQAYANLERRRPHLPQG